MPKRKTALDEFLSVPANRKLYQREARKLDRSERAAAKRKTAKPTTAPNSIRRWVWRDSMGFLWVSTMKPKREQRPHGVRLGKRGHAKPRS